VTSGVVEALDRALTSLFVEISQPRSKVKTLFRVASALFAIHLVNSALGFEAVPQNLRMISVVAGLKYETVRRYVKLLASYGLAFRSGRVYGLAVNLAAEVMDVPQNDLPRPLASHPSSGLPNLPVNALMGRELWPRAAALLKYFLMIMYKSLKNVVKILRESNANLAAEFEHRLRKSKLRDCIKALGDIAAGVYTPRASECFSQFAQYVLFALDLARFTGINIHLSNRSLAMSACTAPRSIGSVLFDQAKELIEAVVDREVGIHG